MTNVTLPSWGSWVGTQILTHMTPQMGQPQRKQQELRGSPSVPGLPHTRGPTIWRKCLDFTLLIASLLSSSRPRSPGRPHPWGHANG